MCKINSYRILEPALSSLCTLIFPASVSLINIKLLSPYKPYKNVISDALKYLRTTIFNNHYYLFSNTFQNASGFLSFGKYSTNNLQSYDHKVLKNVTI